jgi:hypothetical protein
MSQPKRRVVETLVLAATAIFLIGHGGPVGTCFLSSGESRAYNVVGTCGPAGVVTASRPTNDICAVTLTGDDVGLPSSGNLANNLKDGFDLYGSINSDWDLECTAYPPSAPDAGATAPGALMVGCTRRPSAGNPTTSTDRVDWCRGELLPVTPTCDIHACPAVNCSGNEHTAFPASGCCPACVPNGPDDPLPVAPRDVCHRETCPQSCPAGEEFFTPGDTCCSTCQKPPQECLDGRAQWQGEVAARWSSARACAVDADCTTTAFGSPCGSTCIDVIATDQVSTLNMWAEIRGNELCASCNTQAAACPAGQLTRPVCSNGSCVMMGP